MFNANGSKAVGIVVSAELNAILLSDRNGNPRQTVTANIDESNWSIFRPGSDKAQFEVFDRGQGTGLVVRNRANAPQVEMGVSGYGSSLNMSDSKGAIRAAIIGEEIGFATYSKDGKLKWAAGLDSLSPEEREKVKALAPKLPN